MHFLESNFAAYLSVVEEVSVKNCLWVSDPDLFLVVSNLGNRKPERKKGEERLILVQVSHFLSRALELSLMVTYSFRAPDAGGCFMCWPGGERADMI